MKRATFILFFSFCFVSLQSMELTKPDFILGAQSLKEIQKRYKQNENALKDFYQSNILSVNAFEAARDYCVVPGGSCAPLKKVIQTILLNDVKNVIAKHMVADIFFCRDFSRLNKKNHLWLLKNEFDISKIDEQKIQELDRYKLSLLIDYEPLGAGRIICHTNKSTNADDITLIGPDCSARVITSIPWSKPYSIISYTDDEFLLCTSTRRGKQQLRACDRNGNQRDVFKIEKNIMIVGCSNGLCIVLKKKEEDDSAILYVYNVFSGDYVKEIVLPGYNYNHAIMNNCTVGSYCVLIERTTLRFRGFPCKAFTLVNFQTGDIHRVEGYFNCYNMCKDGVFIFKKREDLDDQDMLTIYDVHGDIRYQAACNISHFDAMISNKYIFFFNRLIDNFCLWGYEKAPEVSFNEASKLFEKSTGYSGMPQYILPCREDVKKQNS